MNKISKKFDTVRDLLSGNRVLVAFSGGVDSSVLAHASKQWAKETVLLLVNSETIFEEEIENAKSVAKEIGMDLEIMDFEWLAQGTLAGNPSDRCYQCKKTLAKTWKQRASDLGLDMVVEGTTATEMSGRRPGERALREEEITSPFLIADLTKDELREYARKYDLSVAERPSMACLATRFPYDVEIDSELLQRVGTFEQKIRELTGVRTLRVRYHDEIARIEVAPDERKLFFDTDLLDELGKIGTKLGFQYVTIDAEGYRSGSMDEPLCDEDK